MRFLIALLSLLLLVVCAVALVATPESQAAAVLRGGMHKERSWWRFIVALFTGEVLYEAWYTVTGREAAALEPAAVCTVAEAAVAEADTAVPPPADAGGDGDTDTTPSAVPAS